MSLCSLLMLPLASQLPLPCFVPILLCPSVGWSPVSSVSCLPVLVCTDPVWDCVSAEYDPEDPSGGYYVEFDDATDE